MTIAVLGNCQALAVRGCAEFLTGQQTEFVSHKRIHSAFADGSDAAVKAMLAPYSLVLAQDFGEGAGDLASNATIKSSARRYVRLPTVNFTAFHPDVTYVVSPDGAELISPLGPYHSALTLFGYRAGYSADETISLFRQGCFAALGYLDQWRENERQFRAHCRRQSFPVDEAFAGWTRRGVFMHSVDHPKLFVIEDIARIALTLAGLPMRLGRCTDYLHDGMLNEVWPVYPEIAAAMSLPGSYTFRRCSFPQAPLDRFPPYLDLPAFVRGSYAIYETYAWDSLKTDRIDRWLANEPLRGDLTPL